MDFKNLSLVLREARIKKGYSQKELGEKCGLPQQAINRIEHGHRNIDIELFLKLCNALEIKPGELMGYDLEPIKPQNNLKDILDKRIIIPDNMSEEAKKLLVNYSRLNDNGRKKAIEYTSDLTKIPEYQKSPDQTD